MHVTLLPSDRISNMRENKKRSETGRRRSGGRASSAHCISARATPTASVAPKINRRRKEESMGCYSGGPGGGVRLLSKRAPGDRDDGATLGGGYLSHDSSRRKCLYLDAFPAAFLRRLLPCSPSRKMSQRKRKRQEKKKGAQDKSGSGREGRENREEAGN